MTFVQLIILVGLIVFVTLLLLFPEFRALFSGFVRLFIKDMASTPEGAEAIYDEKINQAQESYSRTDNALKLASGKLTTAKSQMEQLKKNLADTEKKCEMFVRNNQMEEAQLYADSRTEILADIERQKELINAYAQAEATAKEAHRKMEDNLRKLKREQKEVVENMKVKKELKSVYDDMDDLKVVSGTDKLLENVRDKNKDLNAIVEGSRTVYETRTSTRLQKANDMAKQHDSEDYLQSLMNKTH